MKIILPGERPTSWNKFYAGVHWRTRRKEADRVHLLVRSAIDPDLPPFENPVNIIVTAYFKNRPLDASNVCGKMYEDGLLGFVIIDDSPKYVHSFTTRSRVDKENPRVEIDIEEINDEV